mgnify:CR=1 FL=1
MADNTMHMIWVISVLKQIEQTRTKKGDKEWKKKWGNESTKNKQKQKCTCSAI